MVMNSEGGETQDMTKRCRYGHLHPPAVVKAASKNPTRESHGKPRPYHCPECGLMSKEETVPEYWMEYADLERARHAGHPDACKTCFPQRRCP